MLVLMFVCMCACVDYAMIRGLKVINNVSRREI